MGRDFNDRKRGGEMKYFLAGFLALLCSLQGFSNYLVIYPNQLALLGAEESVNADNVEIDVLSGIIPDTFRTRPSYDRAFLVDTENYTIPNLLEKLVGKELNWLFEDGTTGRYTLVCSDPVLLKGLDGIFTPLSGTPVFESLPNINKQRKMNVHFPSPVTSVQASYQFEGLGWEALYTLHLGDTEALLGGTLKINNTLKETVHTENLVLFSGQISRSSRNEAPVARALKMDFYAVEESMPDLESSSFSGYSLYPVPGIYDFPGLRSTYYHFFEFEQPYETRYTFISSYYTNDSEFRALNQTIHLEKLTKALPAGKISIYRERSGETILLGESSVSDKPAGASFDITIGTTIELQAKFELIESRDESKTSYRKYRITVKNYTDQPGKAYSYTSVPKDAVIWLSDNRIERVTAAQLYALIEVAPKAEEELIFGIRYAR
jgi:hypothetical protein